MESGWIHPLTGKRMTFQGGQKGTPVDKNNPGSKKSFDARHDATDMTPKKFEWIFGKGTSAFCYCSLRNKRDLETFFNV